LARVLAYGWGEVAFVWEAREMAGRGGDLCLWQGFLGYSLAAASFATAQAVAGFNAEQFTVYHRRRPVACR